MRSRFAGSDLADDELPVNFYDIHAHILPGVDDGPATMEQAIETIKISSDQGVKSILATPHRRDVQEKLSIKKIRRLVKEINLNAGRLHLDIVTKLGMENHLNSSLGEDLDRGDALTINGGIFVLVEMPYIRVINADIMSALDDLMKRGYIPVIAHPERMEMFQSYPQHFKELVSKGMLSQITAGSILGCFGLESKEFCEDLLRFDLVHVISSDMHYFKGSRRPQLLEGYHAAGKLVGYKIANKLVSTNPQSILNNDPRIFESI